MQKRFAISVIASCALWVTPLQTLHAGGWIGITVQTPQGVEVGEIIKESPADKGGLQKGDIILRIDEEEISSSQHFVDIISQNAPETEHVLNVSRKGQEIQLTVTLEDTEDHPTLMQHRWSSSSAPRGMMQGMGGPPSAPHGMMQGMGGPPPSPPQGMMQGMGRGGTSSQMMPGRHFGREQGMHQRGQNRFQQSSAPQAWLGVAMGHAKGGVLIKKIAPDSPAHRAGLKKGDLIAAINSNAVTNANEMTNIMEDLFPGEKIDLSINRDNQAQTITVELEERPTNR